MSHLLEVTDLSCEFRSEAETTRAVNGVSFHIDTGETLCLVGESGSGKSVTGLSVMGLLAETAVHPSGKVLFRSSIDDSVGEVSLLDASEATMEQVRGARISMIFQEPMTALNPVLTIGEQLMEPLELHLGLVGDAARARAVELLTQVEMPEPERRLSEYPHRLSGGQRQRVMIAMALACEPDLLIADEPTTALDVTIQAQILDLLNKLQERRGTALLFITHDLSVVAQIADRVAVMRQGEIVEQGHRDDVLFAPQHEYTKSLIAALPSNLIRHSTPSTNRVPLISLHDLSVYFPVRKGVLQRHVDDVRAVDGVSLEIEAGRALAVVGESGSGKTTLGRAILGLIKPTSGQALYEGVDLAQLSRRAFKPFRKNLQIVFQDPQSSLNPRLSIGSILTEPMAAHGDRRQPHGQTKARSGLARASWPRTTHAQQISA